MFAWALTLANTCSPRGPRIAVHNATLSGPGRLHEQCALRRGLTDGAHDNLPFPGNWLGNDTWCFAVDTPLTLRFELERAVDEPVAYATDLRVARRDRPDETLWTSRGALQPYEGLVEIALLALPPVIDAYVLDMELITYQRRGDEWREGPRVRRRHTIFAVLHNLHPTGPVWVGALDTAVSWARGHVSAHGAARELTAALHARGTYRAGHSFTQDFGEGEGWEHRFYLRDFLLDPGFPRGQCDDFADFLQVLFTSVGVPAVFVQRSGPHVGPGFRTHPVAVAGSTVARSRPFAYHQYVLDEDARVYDAALAFDLRGSPTRMDADDYRDALFYAEMPRAVGGWSPSAPFRAVLIADPQPP